MDELQDPIELVIFDCDGVLVNSLPVLNRVLSAALAASGLDMGVDEVSRQFTGLSNASIVARAEAMSGSKLPDDFIPTLEKIERSAFETTLQPICGVDQALMEIRTSGVQVCVGSSGSIPYIQFVLGVTRLLYHFEDRLFSSTQVRQGKPYPDLFLYASKQMGSLPKRSVVVEDSIPGVQAAVAAGMRVFSYAAHGDPVALQKAGGQLFTQMEELPKMLFSHSGCHQRPG